MLPTLWVGIEMVKASEEMGRTNGGEDALDPYGESHTAQLGETELMSSRLGRHGAEVSRTRARPAGGAHE